MSTNNLCQLDQQLLGAIADGDDTEVRRVADEMATAGVPELAQVCRASGVEGLQAYLGITTDAAR